MLRHPSRRPATDAEAATLASALRLRIIRLTYDEALTNKELADRLGRDPSTTLHHVRRLVTTGFLVAQPARRGTRGAREIPYRSTGLSWRLAPRTGDIGVESREAMLNAFLAEVADAGTASLDQSRLVLRLDEDGRTELGTRLSALLEEFAGRDRAEGGERIAVYLALYPSE